MGKRKRLIIGRSQFLSDLDSMGRLIANPYITRITLTTDTYAHIYTLANDMKNIHRSDRPN